MTDPLAKPIESYPWGRPGFMTMKVVEILPNNVLNLEAQLSTITGEISHPYAPPYNETHLKAYINQTYITPSSTMYRNIDPLATYALGDRVAVIEKFYIKNPNRMLGGVDLELTDNAGYNPQIEDFIMDPKKYYDIPQERIFDAIYFVVGKWRTFPPGTIADEIHAGPFIFNLNNL